jgi:hypothetical protein
MWRFDGFDAVDFGTELETETGSVFSLTWDPLGDHEGIGLRNVAMLGHGVRDDADVTVWRTGNPGSTWGHLIGNPITGVQLHYYRWATMDSGFWCPHITHADERT